MMSRSLRRTLAHSPTRCAPSRAPGAAAGKRSPARGNTGARLRHTTGRGKLELRASAGVHKGDARLTDAELRFFLERLGHHFPPGSFIPRWARRYVARALAGFAEPGADHLTPPAADAGRRYVRLRSALRTSTMSAALARRIRPLPWTALREVAGR